MVLFYDLIYYTSFIFIKIKICKVYQLSIIIIVYLLFFIFNRRQNIDDHGTIKTIVFIISAILGQIFIFILFFIKNLYKKNRLIVI